MGSYAHRSRLALSGHSTRGNETEQLLHDELSHKWDNRLGKYACVGYIP